MTSNSRPIPSFTPPPFVDVKPPAVASRNSGGNTGERFEVRGSSSQRPGERDILFSESFATRQQAEARLREIQRDHAKGGLLESDPDRPTNLRVERVPSSTAGTASREGARITFDDNAPRSRQPAASSSPKNNASTGGVITPNMTGQPVTDVNHQMRINQALADQHDMLVAARRELMRWDDTAKKNFRMAFGNDSLQARYDMMDQIDKQIKLNQKYSTANFRYAEQKYREPDLVAYVYPNDPNTVYLDDRFFSASRDGRNTIGGTLIHEFSHFSNIAGTDDHAYGERNTTALSALSSMFGKLNPFKNAARNNADNVKYYFEGAKDRADFQKFMEDARKFREGLQKNSTP